MSQKHLKTLKTQEDLGSSRLLEAAVRLLRAGNIFPDVRITAQQKMYLRRLAHTFPSKGPCSQPLSGFSASPVSFLYMKVRKTGKVESLTTERWPIARISA